MNGIDIVIKNQNGKINEVWYGLDSHLFFDCPICHKRRDVNVNCSQSFKTFKIIEDYPHTQLICLLCKSRIQALHGYFKKPTTSYSLGEVYNILKW